MSQETKGQIHRKSIREIIEHNLKNYVPNELPRMANLIAYDFNMSPDTLRYRYLPMFIDKGILIPENNGTYNLSKDIKPDITRKEEFEKLRKEVKEAVKKND